MISRPARSALRDIGDGAGEIRMKNPGTAVFRFAGFAAKTRDTSVGGLRYGFTYVLRVDNSV